MNKKGRIDVVYSTNPDFAYQYDEVAEDSTLPPNKQNLKISLDRKQRKGKIVTVVDNFVGKEEDLNNLSKELKRHCGVGGTAKQGKIIIQGGNIEKTIKFLKAKGYNCI